MKRFFKFLFLLSVVISSVCFSFSCKDKPTYVKYLSELRENIYEGETADVKLKCYYGFKESPYSHDGVVGKKIYSLTFILELDELSPATYNLELNFNGKSFKGAFSYTENSAFPSLSFNIENFTEKTFSVKVSKGEIINDITLSSVIPEKTISYEKALNSVFSSAPDLISSFKEGDEFCGEINERVLIRNDKAYYYIALISSDNVKAFLVDGTNGELLAIRTVI